MANDTQTRLNKVKDAIDALMDGRAVQAYSINGRRIEKCSLKELMDLEQRLKEELASQTDTTAYGCFEDPE